MSNRVPPQVAPLLVIGRLVSGGVHEDTTGYDGWSAVTRPLSRPAMLVTTLNVEPGKYRSW